MFDFSRNITEETYAPYLSLRESSRDCGRGISVTHGFYPTTELGMLQVARTPYGICWTGFMPDGKRNFPFERLQRHLPHADFQEDDAAIKESAVHIMQIWRGAGNLEEKLILDLYGTDFQRQVWRALLQIPTGQTVCYQDVAVQVGRPKAARPVGSAVGANPVSLLIPCHRVIQKSGVVDNYGWGTPQKKLILKAENVPH